MVCMNHGDLPTAALHGGFPPPYTFNTCNLNFISKFWSKSMIHSPDLLEDTLKRPITTILPSITTTHHDGGLPSPLFYTLADDKPPLPSTGTQLSRQNLRERRQFRNNGWTKWEAVQLADELEATQVMVKADWECSKKFEEQFSDLDEDDQDKARQDKMMRQRQNVDLLQHAQEMDMLPYSLSLPPTAWVSGTKSSAQRKRRKTRSKRAGTFISCAAGSGEKLIEEEAKNACARPHSGIRLSIINKVDNDSIKGVYDNGRNKTNNETANANKEMIIGGSGFSLHSPGYICKGSIVLNIHNNNICEGIDESTGAGGMFGSRPVYPISVNHACILTNIVVCPVSFVHTWEGETQLILKIIVEVQGADLRRFDKHKKRATLWTLKIFVEAKGADLWRFDEHKKRATLGMGEYPPEKNCTLFCCTQGIEVWMGNHPLPSYAELQNCITGSSLI
jgi:hypothetical protein